MKILFPRPVRVNGTEIYPPDYKFASLAEEDGGELYVLSDWNGTDFEYKKHIGNRSCEINMLFAITRYACKLMDELSERYKQKHNIPDWEPKEVEVHEDSAR